MSKYILGIDPSGSFNEGKGITGFALLSPKGKLITHTFVNAKDYNTQIDYWKGILDEINAYKKRYKDLVISIEDYVLYANSAKSQINSEMETSKLIGAIAVHAHTINVPLYKRNASQVKNRWNNDILVHKNFITKQGNKWLDSKGNWINKHCLDALRHALHCYYFELER